MKKFVFAVFFLLQSVLPLRAEHPLRGEEANVLLDRISLLRERCDLRSFDRLTPQLLDAMVMCIWPTAFNPFPQAVQERGTRPGLFGPHAVTPNGVPADICIAKKDASAIALHFFGKAAPLQAVRDSRLYAMSHDAPRLCMADAQDWEKQGDGYLISGVMLCAKDGPGSEVEEKEKIRLRISANHKAPLGWEVSACDFKAMSGDPYSYTNARYGFSVSWMRGQFRMQESDNGDGMRLSSPIDPAFDFRVWGSQAWDVLGLDFKAGIRDTEQWFDSITLRRVDEKKGSFVLSGYSGKDILYVKGLYGEGSTVFLSIRYARKDKEIYDAFVTGAANSLRRVAVELPEDGAEPSGPATDVAQTPILVRNGGQDTRGNHSFFVTAPCDLTLDFCEVRLDDEGKVHRGAVLRWTELNAGEVCQFRTLVPENLPKIMVCAEAAGTGARCWIPMFSGEDGSLILAPGFAEGQDTRPPAVVVDLTGN